MEFFNNLTPGRKLVAVFIGLFVGAFLFEVVLAHLNAQPLVWEQHLAQGFYYAAIGFAIYHMFTRSKQRKDEEAKKAAESETEVASGEIAEDRGEKN